LKKKIMPSRIVDRSAMPRESTCIIGSTLAGINKRVDVITRAQVREILRGLRLWRLLPHRGQAVTEVGESLWQVWQSCIP